MDKQQALYKLWHDGTGVPSYREGAVPDFATLPYVTYESIVDSLDGSVMPTGTIWMRTDSYSPLDAILAALDAYIGRGKLISYDDGVMLVNKATPFAQSRTDEDDKSVKGYLVSLQIEFLSK